MCDMVIFSLGEESIACLCGLVGFLSFKIFYMHKTIKSYLIKSILF